MESTDARVQAGTAAPRHGRERQQADPGNSAPVAAKRNILHRGPRDPALAGFAAGVAAALLLAAASYGLAVHGVAGEPPRLPWFWTAMSAVLTLLLGAFAVLFMQFMRRGAAQQALLERQRWRLLALNADLENRIANRTRDLRQARSGLAQADARLHDLSARIIDAQEQERRHIARELHDETGQALTVIRMHLAELAQQGGADATRIASCIDVVNRAGVHIRGVALSLRPPMLDDLGLGDAIEWVLEQQTAAVGWQGSFDGDEADRRFPADVETACFRIAQEALTNAARYAHASEVKVALRIVARELELTVADNGQGFDLARFRSPDERTKHFGLVSMFDRAGLAGGRLEVDTAPGHGTHVRATFPLAV